MSDDWAPPESDFQAAAPKDDSSWAPPESDFSPKDVPKDEGAPPETAGRVAGLAARGVVTGAAGLPDMIDMLANPIAHFARQAIDPTEKPDDGNAYKPQLSDFVHPEKWQQAAEFFADKAGMPKVLPDGQGGTQGAAERVGYKIAQALPSAALAPEAPVMGALSAAAGAGASGTAKEAGASPGWQAAAGLAAGSIPAAASGIAQAGRGLLRDSAENVRGRIADAANVGTDLTASQASGSRVLAATENTLGRLPGAGSPIKNFVAKQQGQLGKAAADMSEDLGGGEDLSPTTAGAAINKGGHDTMDSMRAQEDAAYRRLDAHVPKDHPIDVSGTLAKLDSLAAPVPGAEATTGALVSPKVKEIRDNLTADMAASAAKNGPVTDGVALAPQPDAMAEQLANETAVQKSAGTLPYQGVRAIRTRIGNSIDWGFPPKDPQTNGALKQVYGQLTEDLGNGVKQVGPEAEQAANNASSLYVANQARRKALGDVIDKAGGPEYVYQAATNGTKLGASRLNTVMGALDSDQQRLLQGTVINRMGRANPSAQNAEGSAFSPETFLTNWNKMDPKAKDIMFGPPGSPASTRSGLNSLTNTLSAVRRSNVIPNAPNTAESLIKGQFAWELMKKLAMGSYGEAGGMAGAAVGGNLLSRVLTNKNTVNWLAKNAKMPTSGLPNAVNQLRSMDDPDADDLADAVQPRTARATGGKVHKPSVNELVEHLIKRWKDAKKSTDKSTEKLLKVPDATIVKALDIAGRAI